MGPIQIAAVSLGITCILHSVWKVRRGGDLGTVADLTTIYGVVLGFVVLFRIGPQEVQVQHQDRPVLHRVLGRQHVVIPDPGKPPLLDRPPIWITGSVTNYGDTVATGLVLEFMLVSRGELEKPWCCMTAAVFGPADPKIPPLTRENLDSLRDDIGLWPSQPRARVLLPALGPNESIAFLLWYERAPPSVRVRDLLLKAAEAGAEVRLARTDENGKIIQVISDRKVPLEPTEWRTTCGF
jgi:hypothetical protein